MPEFTKDEIQFKELAERGNWGDLNSAHRIINQIKDTGGLKAIDRLICAFRDDPRNPFADHLFNVLSEILIPRHS